MRRRQMTEQERRSRSRLKLFISYSGFLRGTLTMREHTCGKPNCKCTRGQKHRSLYLTRSKNGKVEQLYVPKEKETAVKQLVKQYRIVQDLLEKISLVYWNRVKKGG